MAFCLIGGFLVPLATFIISPILINIFLFHLFLDTQGLPLAVFMILAASFILWSYRSMFIWLFKYNTAIDPNSFYNQDILVEKKN